MISERTQRMIDSAPSYYQYSNVYEEIQNAIGADLDRIAANNEDLKLQRRILTATWGLKYWEERLGIPTIESDSYEIRRSRVLSKWRSPGNFSAALIKSVAEAFSGGEVEVTFYRKNLLPPLSQWTKNASAGAVVVSDYEGSINPTSDYVGFTYDLNRLLPMLKGKTVTISIETLTGTNIRFHLTKVRPGGTTYPAIVATNGVFIDGKKYSAIIENDVTSLSATINNDQGARGVHTFKNPQLEVGAVATKFEPRLDDTVGINFVGSRGVPTNLDDLKAQIDNIVHAHLGVDYYFTYLTFAELDNTNRTWQQLDDLNLTWEQFDVWKP